MKRFWDKVDKSGACWTWTACRDACGYGQFYIGRAAAVRRRTERAHRQAWKLSRGSIPYGLHVLHRCDNPACVNPSHLFLGTHRDNMDDMHAKGRGRKAHGERYPQAKLREQDIRDIRAKYAIGYSQRAIGQAYGVSHATVGRIVLGQRWAHV